MPEYDADQFDPPAPLALVTVKLSAPETTILNIPMLLDTGADVSLLPSSSFAQYATNTSQLYELEAFDGTKSTAPAITAELQLSGKSFRGQFLLVDNWYGILGRNILNNLTIKFDGPAQTWSLL